ncbi:Embryonic fatty acid-binding protein Bm-FAB-1 [Trichuris trichiura]|uniref:Embryonic fatty acid-binding protein Bm-FAB-1 n=1 Tax=Trichuris trichiura TaxID=36087 RepID=A0A077YX80_TRITR|nr:Embryonic fatty acid-binding protein Bm-FAB-1 [Trichuris trichiura]
MENLLGKYRGVATENMEAYFKAKGMVWALRKMILSLMNPKNAVREFCKNEDGTFSYKDTGSTRSQVEWTFRIGEEFVACSYDGKDHKIKFEFDSSGQKLLEKHVIVEDPSQEQTYEHYLDDGRLIWPKKLLPPVYLFMQISNMKAFFAACICAFAVSVNAGADNCTQTFQIFLTCADKRMKVGNVEEQLEDELNADFSRMVTRCFSPDDSTKTPQMCPLRAFEARRLPSRNVESATFAVNSYLKKFFFDRQPSIKQCIRRNLYNSFPNYIRSCYKREIHDPKAEPEILPNIDGDALNISDAVLDVYLVTVEMTFQSCLHPTDPVLPVRAALIEACANDSSELKRMDAVQAAFAALSFFQAAIDRFDRFCQADCPHDALLQILKNTKGK